MKTPTSNLQSQSQNLLVQNNTFANGLVGILKLAASSGSAYRSLFCKPFQAFVRWKDGITAERPDVSILEKSLKKLTGIREKQTECIHLSKRCDSGSPNKSISKARSRAGSSFTTRMAAEVEMESRQATSKSVKGAFMPIVEFCNEVKTCLLRGMCKGAGQGGCGNVVMEKFRGNTGELYANIVSVAETPCRRTHRLFHSKIQLSSNRMAFLMSSRYRSCARDSI